jgi:purine-nucleoside phosphorylase
VVVAAAVAKIVFVGAAGAAKNVMVIGKLVVEEMMVTAVEERKVLQL